MLSLTTVAATPDHRCFIDEIDSNSTKLAWNSSIFLSSIPSKNGVLDACSMYGVNKSIVPCESYVYDKTYYLSSRTMEWNFVCDQRWRISIAQTIYMFGVFAGSSILGNMADKYGRKPIFCMSGLFQLIFGILVALVPWYVPFLTLQFFYGMFGSAGGYTSGFVLTMELVGSSKRTACGVAFQAMFSLGICLVGIWAAFIKDRFWLQIIYALHSLVLIAHWWLMDESPRWLWQRGKREEAAKIVAKGVKMNGTGIPLDQTYYLTKAKMNESEKTEAKDEASISDLFRTPNLRIKTLNVCFCYFANSIAYYGLSLNAGKLYGNPFIILFVMGISEVPVYLALIFVLDLLGRRSITSTLMVLGGACCIIAAYIPQGTIITTSIVMIGKLLIAGSFAVIYNYSAELFPTVVRNSAMGLGGMCARLSAALTPLLTLLDSFDPTIPAITFGIISLISGLWVLMLPETMNQPMPQSIADGENFGKGETAFSTCCGRNKRQKGEYCLPADGNNINEKQ